MKFKKNNNNKNVLKVHERFTFYTIQSQHRFFFFSEQNNLKQDNLCKSDVMQIRMCRDVSCVLVLNPAYYRKERLRHIKSLEFKLKTTTKSRQGQLDTKWYSVTKKKKKNQNNVIKCILLMYLDWRCVKQIVHCDPAVRTKEI